MDTTMEELRAAKIALDWLLSPNRKILVGSAKILVDVALRTEVHRVLCIKLNQLRGLSRFVCVMEHVFVHVVVHGRAMPTSAKLLLSALGCLH